MQQNEKPSEYSPQEIMVASAAKEIHNREVVFVGIGLPVLACLLAQRLHAPDMVMVYEAGVIPESEGKIVPCLFVEADGTSVALQREKSRRAEVKIGIAHEGWQEVSTDRYRTKEKTVYSKNMVLLGKVIDLDISLGEMKVTHLVLQLEKQVAKDLLGKMIVIRHAKCRVSTQLIESVKDAVILRRSASGS
jgi:sporulation protein YlmC with PRC-barrel domain